MLPTSRSHIWALVTLTKIVIKVIVVFKRLYRAKSTLQANFAKRKSGWGIHWKSFLGNEEVKSHCFGDNFLWHLLLSGLQWTFCRFLWLYVKPIEGKRIHNAMLCTKFLSKLNLLVANLVQGPFKAPLPAMLFSDLNRKLLVLQNVAEEGFYRLVEAPKKLSLSVSSKMPSIHVQPPWEVDGPERAEVSAKSSGQGWICHHYL